MIRRIFVFFCLLLIVLLLTVSLVEAQQAEKVYRVGWLGIGGPGSQRKNKLKPSPQFIAFRQRLRELGYVEGQNLVLQYRWAEGKRERLPHIAAEFVRRKVDVIVTSSARPAIRAA